jgi:hypothetical protein
VSAVAEPTAPAAGRALACERCARRPAAVCATDEPENEGALGLGDQLAGWLLCLPCLRQTERDGPWSAEDRLDPAA